MTIITDRVLNQIPALYGSEETPDPTVWAKYFAPWSNWTWYVMEFDGIDLMFGLVVGECAELGYFSLSEIESVRGPFGLNVERDMYFQPKPLSEVSKSPALI